MALFAAPKNTRYPCTTWAWEGVNQLKSRQTISAVKRVFFAPVDHRKFNEMREQQQRQILRIDLFNIR